MNLRPRKRTSPQIPIVAMVDILVIVLLFVVATTTFKKKKKDTHLQIALPQSASLGGATTVKETRKTISVTKDKKLFLDGVEMTETDLATALKALKSSQPDAKLELQADQDTPLGLLVKIWDALKAGGYSINEVPARIQRATEK